MRIHFEIRPTDLPKFMAGGTVEGGAGRGLLLSEDAKNMRVSTADESEDHHGEAGCWVLFTLLPGSE